MARGDSDDEILRNPIFELDRKGLPHDVKIKLHTNPYPCA